MVVKKKSVPKKVAPKKSPPKIKQTKVVEKVVEEEGGTSLDDAFGDDDGVEYAQSKPAKPKKKKDEDDDEAVSEDELEEEVEEIEHDNGLDDSASEHEVSSSKPISQLKKGDVVVIDEKEYNVDAHYVLIDHGSTKEMALEIYDSVTDKDYQLRYFNDQVEATLELYELKDILYVKKPFRSVGW